MRLIEGEYEKPFFLKSFQDFNKQGYASLLVKIFYMQDFKKDLMAQRMLHEQYAFKIYDFNRK